MIRSKKIRFELSAEEFLFIMCWKILLLQFDQNWELEEVIKHHFYVKIKKIFLPSSIVNFNQSCVL